MHSGLQQSIQHEEDQIAALQKEIPSITGAPVAREAQQVLDKLERELETVSDEAVQARSVRLWKCLIEEVHDPFLVSTALLLET